MARTAKVQRLTALAVRRYAEASAIVSPLHDGGGLYLRKRNVGCFWYLRLTEPTSGAQQWHRMFPDDPLACYPHRTLADARTEAKRLWDLRSSGFDPRAERLRSIVSRREAEEEAEAAEKRKVTVRALCERWCAVDLQPRLGTDGKRIGRKDGGSYVARSSSATCFPRSEIALLTSSSGVTCLSYWMRSRHRASCAPRTFY